MTILLRAIEPTYPNRERAHRRRGQFTFASFFTCLAFPLWIALTATAASGADVEYTGVDGSTGHTCEECSCGENSEGECVVIWDDGFESPCLSCTENEDGSTSYAKPKRRWYLGTSRYQDFDVLAERVLSPALVFGLDGSSLGKVSTQTDWMIEGGAILQLSPSFSLDFGLGFGRGSVDADLAGVGPAGPMEGRARADVEMLSGRLDARFYPFAESRSRVKPWISAGARGLAVRPDGGRLDTFGELRELEDLSTEGLMDFTTGLGADIRLSEQVDLTVGADYGFESGTRSWIGVKVALGSPDRFESIDRFPLPTGGFKTLEIPDCDLESITPNPAIQGDSITFQGKAIGNPSLGCNLGVKWYSTLDGGFGSSNPSVEWGAGGRQFTIGEHDICMEASYFNCPPNPNVAYGVCKQCKPLEVLCPEVPPGEYCGKPHTYWADQICRRKVKLIDKPPFDGTPGNDLILGDEGNNTISGQGGDDCIYGFGGDDILHGDRTGLSNQFSGNDVIYGGTGNDRIWGDAKGDELHGGPGNDNLQGDSGNDEMYGDTGNDHLDGDSGDDRMHGGDGRDTLLGGSGRDVMYGDDGEDTMRGDSGNDVMHGGNHADHMNGDSGNNEMHGGPGNDHVEGGGNRDNLFGDEGNDVLKGNAGNDTLHGGPGRDKLKGDSGNDTCFGGPGNDFCKGDSGRDTLHGEDGNDRICGNSGSDSINGGPGSDSCREKNIIPWWGSDGPTSNCESRPKYNQCTTNAWKGW